MQQLSQNTCSNAEQWLALFDSIALFDPEAVKQFHELHLAQYGPELMARVYRASLELLLEKASDLQRVELGRAFRRGISAAIDAHFSRSVLGDSTLWQNLAENAKEWLAFTHCMLLADKVPFHQAYAGFLSAYNDEFIAQVYQKAFEQVLHQAPGESIALLSAFKHALDQGLGATRYQVAA